MKPVAFGIVLLIISIASCLTPWKMDKLVYYQKGYNPNYTAKLNTHGFYYNKENASDWKYEFPEYKNPQPLTPKYFYRDGSVAYGSTYPDIDSLKAWNIKYNSYENYATWGFYKIQGDTIYIESIYFDPLGDGSARRTELVGALKNDSIIIVRVIDYKGKATSFSVVWYFESFNCKPDSTKNRLKKHRKYRIDK